MALGGARASAPAGALPAGVGKRGLGGKTPQVLARGRVFWGGGGARSPGLLPSRPTKGSGTGGLGTGFRLVAGPSLLSAEHYLEGSQEESGAAQERGVGRGPSECAGGVPDPQTPKAQLQTRVDLPQP